MLPVHNRGHRTSHATYPAQDQLSVPPTYSSMARFEDLQKRDRPQRTER